MTCLDLLEVVLDVGFLAHRGLTEAQGLVGRHYERSPSANVKGAIPGPAPNLNRDGKAISFSVALGHDGMPLPWQCFRPIALVQHVNTQQHSPESDSQGPPRSTGLTVHDDDPLLDLLGANG